MLRFGPIAAGVALAFQGISKDKKKINIVTGAATTDLTGKQCSPYGFHWAYDTRALAVGTGGALVEQGGSTWFFITADYAFGHSLEAETARYVTSKGGKVVGAVRHPLATTDYSSFILQAQTSGAKIRGFAKRFMERTGRMPNMVHSGTYSAVGKYLKAIQAAGADATESVAKKLHEMPVDDFFARNGKVLPNGRMIHDMYLFQVKAPQESEGPWDYYKHLSTIPGDQAFATLQESGCQV